MQNAPLAERMRPRTIDEVIGQKHVIGKDTALGSIIRSKTQAIPSMIFVGPPGVGKTTLAKVIACLLYTSPSPRDLSTSRMPSSA